MLQINCEAGSLDVVMEDFAGGTELSDMPPQLLCNILANVPQTDRLQRCALVCRSWQRAATAATTSIKVAKCSQQQLSSLVAWLEANPFCTSVTSLTVSAQEVQQHPLFTGWHSQHGDIFDQDQLQQLLPIFNIPTSRLVGLKSLSLHNMQVELGALQVVPHVLGNYSSPSAGPAQATMMGVVTAVQEPQQPLPCLTSLYLGGHMLFPALGALTNLESFKLSGSFEEPPEKYSTEEQQHAADILQLADAILSLTRVTSLSLSGRWCQDPILQSTTCLTNLSVLQVRETPCCTQAGFNALPLSITRFDFDYANACWDDGYRLDFGPAVTPGLCKLTALKDLSLTLADDIGTGIFEHLPHLEELQVACSVVVVSPDGLRFERLSRLTKLHTLYFDADYKLEYWDLTPAEAAAFTSSTHLRSLCLAGEYCRWTVQSYENMFSMGRTLPDLTSLTMGMGILALPDATRNMVASCPNLVCLDLSHDDDADYCEALLGVQAAAKSLEHLTGLRSLLRCCIFLEIEDLCAIPSNEALNATPNDVHGASCNMMGLMSSALQLTKLKQLQHLHLRFSLHNVAPTTHPTSGYVDIQASADINWLESRCHGDRPAGRDVVNMSVQLPYELMDCLTVLSDCISALPNTAIPKNFWVGAMRMLIQHTQEAHLQMAQQQPVVGSV